MAPRALTTVFAATAVAIVVILVLWVYPGFLSTTTSCPVQTTADGRAYCAETVTVGQCASPYACIEPPPGFVFHGVKFQLRLGGSSGLAYLGGWITEGNSTSYQFSLTGDYLGAPSVNWTTPDHVALVEMQTPYAFIGSEGQLEANVTCGVSLGTINGT
ncbi:MAG: hypothetical protein ABSA63_06595 [Thermoplasmata archaeon]|jgi:hypothetical protein